MVVVLIAVVVSAYFWQDWLMFLVMCPILLRNSDRQLGEMGRGPFFSLGMPLPQDMSKHAPK